jgi:hypothetical protein
LNLNLEKVQHSILQCLLDQSLTFKHNIKHSPIDKIISSYEKIDFKLILNKPLSIKIGLDRPIVDNEGYFNIL